GVVGPQRLVVVVGGLVVLIALGLVLFAWYDETIRPRRELAMEVGDRSYSMDDFAKRYGQAVQDPANSAALQSSLVSDIPERVARQIEGDAILLQRAHTLGISFGQNEIDREMLVRLGVPVVTDTPEGQEVGPDDAFTVTPAMEQTVRAELQQYGYTLEEYREIAHAQLLRDKVLNSFKEQTPARAPQVRIRLLQFPSESDSRIAIDKIKNGEATFVDLAENVSLDRAGKGRGGERDWLTRGILPPQIDDVVFSIPVNTLSEPIDTGPEMGWIVAEVLERADERDVSDDVRRQLADQQFQEWMDQQKETLSVNNALTEAKIRWAEEQATLPISLTQSPAPSGLPSNKLPVAPST
ncbi:MAG: peptidylprolyl isomerase, partial [Dehalococcoidia bacterium]